MSTIRDAYSKTNPFLINCYKILEVPNFSDIKTIQRGYRLMAKKYHPDVNKTAQAHDIFVLVSKAYQTLTNNSTKISHDLELKNALLWSSEGAYKKQINQRKHQGVTPQKRREWAYSAAKKEILDFENGNRRFPYSIRIFAGSVFALFALQIIYNNYFVDLNSNELPFMILGYGMFIVSAVSILAHVYTKLRIDLLLKRAKFAYDKFSFALFFAILIIGPSSVWGLNNYRKSYHLQHYPALATAKIVEITKDQNVVFAFTPAGSEHVIMKKKQLDEQSIFNTDEAWIIIRYSIADPRIVELVKQVTD